MQLHFNTHIIHSQITYYWEDEWVNHTHSTITRLQKICTTSYGNRTDLRNREDCTFGKNCLVIVIALSLVIAFEPYEQGTEKHAKTCLVLKLKLMPKAPNRLSFSVESPNRTRTETVLYQTVPEPNFFS